MKCFENHLRIGAVDRLQALFFWIDVKEREEVFGEPLGNWCGRWATGFIFFG
jgi:hypothetical protein